MYCKNCGMENGKNARFCKECGAEFNSIMTPKTIQPNDVTSNAAGSLNVCSFPKKKSPIKIIAIVGGILVAVIILASWLFGPELSVSDVKDGELIGYPSDNIGDAFEDYFSRCSWDSFTADEDDSVSVVEFTGYIETEDGDRVKVAVQFTHDSDSDDEDDFEIRTVKLTSGGKNTYLSDYELDDMLSAIYYGGSFSWLW